jgi:hypothetical protein
LESGELKKYNILSRFHLSIKGKKGEHCFILLRSKRECWVLAPISAPNHSNQLDSDILRYPQEESAIRFDPQAGPGWRELIVVKSPKAIPYPAGLFSAVINC